MNRIEKQTPPRFTLSQRKGLYGLSGITAVSRRHNLNKHQDFGYAHMCTGKSLIEHKISYILHY